MTHALRCCFLCLCLVAGGAAQAQTLKAWAYVAWWLPESWKAVPLESLERVLFFHVKIQADGALERPEGWPENWVGLRDAAQAAGKPVDLTLTLLTRHDFITLFGSPEAVRKLLNEATQLAIEPGVSGLHLDVELYEAAPRAPVQAFQAFVLELQRRLHALAEPRTLTAFVPLGGPTALYDTPQLSRLDGVVLQGYDAHWQDSPTAGPVAPLEGLDSPTWRSALRQADRWGLPRGSIRMSFPLYGYEWTVRSNAPRARVRERADITSYSPLPEELVPDIRINVQDRVQAYGAHYDALSGSAYYAFTDGQGRRRVGWFEDAQTLDRKIRFLQDAHLGGVAFFPLGYDNGKLVQHYLQQAGSTEVPGP